MPEELVNICSELLEELSRRPIQCYFLEIINMRRILFLAISENLTLGDRGKVELHFKECTVLLSSYGSVEDAYSVLTILRDRLVYFQLVEL